MSDLDRSNLVEAWDAAGLPAEALAPVLNAFDRVAGERVFAEFVQPAIQAVYVGDPGTVTEREARRLRLFQVVAYLLHVGAIADVLGRFPEKIVRR
jgi:hypothetical protein